MTTSTDETLMFLRVKKLAELAKAAAFYEHPDAHVALRNFVEEVVLMPSNQDPLF
jgi:hypothetical protein